MVRNPVALLRDLSVTTWTKKKQGSCGCILDFTPVCPPDSRCCCREGFLRCDGLTDSAQPHYSNQRPVSVTDPREAVSMFHTLPLRELQRRSRIWSFLASRCVAVLPSGGHATNRCSQCSSCIAQASRRQRGSCDSETSHAYP